MESSALLVAWLLTYLVHSTVLLGSAWVVTRLIRSNAYKEALWKCALVGGLVSATLQLGLGFEPLGGRMSLNHSQESEEIAVSMIPDSRRAPVHESRTVPEHEEVRGAALSVEPTNHGAWPWLLIGLLPAAFALASLSLAWARLKCLLSKRKAIREGALSELLAGLLQKAGIQRDVRLTCSKRVRVPLAIGIVRPEICLPERAMTGLSVPEQESMLAHELAHLVRNDPAWLALFRVLEIVFFFQPLNRVGRNEWLDLAEYRCDAWAVERLGGSLSLARCLTEVAGWMVEPKLALQGAAAHGMARNRSSLSRRVKRLLQEPGLRDGRIRKGWLALLASGLLLFTTGSIPGFSVEISDNETMKELTPPVGEMSISDQQALLEALELLDGEIVVLKMEVLELGGMIKGSGWEPELGALLREAEERIRIFQVRREQIELMIRPAKPFSAPEGVRTLDEMERSLRRLR